MIGLFFFVIMVAFLGAVIITVWWLWQRATAADGEPAPKWGDLRSLRRVLMGQSIIIRMIAVAILAGVMTIPMLFIEDLTRERYDRYRSVVSKISSSWGSSQVLTGPVLYVPYIVRYQTAEEVPLTAAELALEQSRGSGRTTREVVKNYTDNRAALVLPEKLSIDGRVSTETRYRSIYSARVYIADARVSGSFAKHDLTGLHSDISEVLWDKAVLVMGVTSTKAIRSISDLEIAGGRYKFLPGTGGVSALPIGFSAPCGLSGLKAGENFDFSFDVSVGGSGEFYMTPVGVVSGLKLASDWPHPNFTGSGLPTSRDVRLDGFSAEWDVPNLVRNYPQISDASEWVQASAFSAYTPEETTRSDGHNMSEYIVGLEFFEPVFHYSLLTRATKYGLLFIALTFLGVVIFENYYGKRGGAMMSMAQYVVIGAALALFYLTLLAASEHFGFTAAYVIASALVVAMTGGYVAAAMRRKRPAVMISAVQSLLYALLFFILRMEDHSLLAGTVLLAIAIAALMAVTRNVNRRDDVKES